MTPTDITAAIEAALPHVPAGITSGDLTKPEDRRAFAERLALIFAVAGLSGPESDEQGSEGSSGPPKRSDGHTEAVRDPEWLRMLDKRIARDKITVLTYEPIKLVASNDWPPPDAMDWIADYSGSRSL